MTMIEQDKDDALLDDLFTEARSLRPMPSDAVMARVLQDAAALQSGRAAVRPAPPPPSPVGWRALLAVLGGWPAVGGLVAATLAGVWIGAAPPEGLVPYTSQLWGGAVTVELLPEADALGLEES
jgi:hypothetical protein